MDTVLLLLSLVAALTRIIALSPAQRETILHHYKDNYTQIAKEYVSYQSDQRKDDYLSGNILYDVPEANHLKNRTILREILHGTEEEPIIVTMEHYVQFISPAIVKYSVFEDGKFMFNFYVIITEPCPDPSTYNFKVKRVVPYSENDESDLPDTSDSESMMTFTFPSVRDSNLLEETYRTAKKSNGMRVLYVDWSQKMAELEEYCDQVKSETSPEHFNFVNAEIVIKDFVLLLNEKQKVRIPGLLRCTRHFGDDSDLMSHMRQFKDLPRHFRVRSDLYFHNYYVLGDVYRTWIHVYRKDEEDMVVDGKPAVALELYLIR